MDALALDENREAGLLLTAIDALMKEAGISEAVVVHHMGHANERTRGDSRLRDWPDAEWKLTRLDTEDPSSRRFFSAYGRDVDVAECEISMDETTRHLTVVGGSRRDAKVDDAVEAVVRIVSRWHDEKKPHPSGRDIEKALAGGTHGRDAVRAAIKRAVDQALIVEGPAGQGGGVTYVVNPDAPAVARPAASPGQAGLPMGVDHDLPF
jgi:hypothetical protein